MYRTGQTIYMQVISSDEYSQPVSAATFNTKLFKNSAEDLTTTISSGLTNSETAIFTFSFTPVTTGMYQLYCKNNLTNVLFISDIFHVVSDDYLVDTEIYIGF